MVPTIATAVHPQTPSVPTILASAVNWCQISAPMSATAVPITALSNAEGGSPRARVLRSLSLAWCLAAEHCLLPSSYFYIALLKAPTFFLPPARIYSMGM